MTPQATRGTSRAVRTTVGGRVAEGSRCGAARRTSPSSLSRGVSFVTTAAAPAAMAASRTVSSRVNITTPTSSIDARTARNTSSPLSRGMSLSSTTTSGRVSRISCSASAPSAAAPVRAKSLSDANASRSPSRTLALSSATSTWSRARERGGALAKGRSLRWRSSASRTSSELAYPSCTRISPSGTFSD